MVLNREQSLDPVPRECSAGMDLTNSHVILQQERKVWMGAVRMPGKITAPVLRRKRELGTDWRHFYLNPPGKDHLFMLLLQVADAAPQEGKLHPGAALLSYCFVSQRS